MLEVLNWQRIRRSGLGWFFAEVFEDGAEVGPDVLAVFDGVGAQEVGGVEGGHDRNLWIDMGIRMPRPADPGDALGGLEDEFGGGSAEGDDGLGADGFDLLAEVSGACIDFIGGGISVAGGAALDDVGDVNLCPVKTHSVDLFFEELAGAADEGASLLVFVLSGALADEHDLGVVVAFSEDGVGSTLVESAAHTPGYFVF